MRSKPLIWTVFLAMLVPFLGLGVASAQDGGTSSITGEPVQVEEGTQVNSGDTLTVRGSYTVSQGASVTLEDGDGTVGTLTDGVNAQFEATETGLVIRVTGEPTAVTGGNGVLNTEDLTVRSSSGIEPAGEGTTPPEETTTVPPEETTGPTDEQYNEPDPAPAPPPEETTTVPPEETTMIEETTVVPEETTVVPEETTVVPEETTVAPEETAQAPPPPPEETTVAPEETTVIEETTVVPEETTEEPTVEETTEETTRKPTVEEPTVEEPETTVEQPDENIDFGDDPKLPETGGASPLLPAGSVLLGCALVGYAVVRRR